MKTPIIIWLSLLTVLAKAQILPSDTVPAIIKTSNLNGLTKFESELRPLRQIAGAPSPFYTYFWEFGDGSFSFEQNPTHIYKTLDSVMVRLYATNNYDDGKRPPTKPKPIKPGAGKPMLANNNLAPTLFKNGGNIALKTNCMPKPGDDMMMVFGYRNKVENGLQNLNGTIALLYNDKGFTQDNFTLTETRTYHQEKKNDLRPLLNTATAAIKNQKEPVFYASINEEAFLDKLRPEEKILLKDKVKDFKSIESYRFDQLMQGEERFVFMHFKTTPEMVKDTNAVVKISAVFIPDNPLVESEFFNLELQIVASHDPNKMVLRQSRMNYRFTGKHRELTYKIRFQNTGKGPAKKIDVATNIAKVFDASTLKIKSTKPEVINCDSAYANQSCLKTVFSGDSVHFVFNNIYLPGMQQDGVKDADSTMGFVEYQIKFKEKPEKLPIKSGAAIIFDKNEPIYTNRAVGRFKMGLSPGIIIGYGYPFQANHQNFLNNKNFVIGGTLSPYASHRYYWQVELYFNSFRENTFLVASTTAVKDTVINRIPYQVTKKDYYQTNKAATINAVPLQMRYNINKYVATGVGALVSLDLYHKNTSMVDYSLRSASANGVITNSNQQFIIDQTDRKFSDFRANFFADIQLGLVRVGPSVGLRYLYDPKTNNNRMVSYITWKF